MLSDHRLLGTLVKSTSLLMEGELYTCTSIAISTVSACTGWCLFIIVIATAITAILIHKN